MRALMQEARGIGQEVRAGFLGDAEQILSPLEILAQQSVWFDPNLLSQTGPRVLAQCVDCAAP